MNGLPSISHVLMSETPTIHAEEKGGGLHGQIRRDVLQRILSGQVLPGRRLSVSALADEIGISRTPVREALLQLQREGFLTLEDNRGFFVRELTERAARELYPILHSLEDLALVTGGRPPRSHLERLEELNERLARSTAPDESVALNYAWHRLLTGVSSNRELALLLDRYRMRVYLYEHTYYAAGDERVEYSVSLHRRILAAFRAGDLSEARRVLKQHWVGDYSLYLPTSASGSLSTDAVDLTG